MKGAIVGTVALAWLCAGCGDSSGDPSGTPGPSGWQPGTVLPSGDVTLRGLRDVRGVIHAHSVYSHDACDGAPRSEVDDSIDEACFDDFRRDVCRVAHDFVMLTDHGESFSRSEFPDTLLYRADRGDALIERDGTPVANRAACDPADLPAAMAGDAAAHATLVMAGNESAMLPVGLEGHVAATEAERDAIYGTASADNVALLKAAGAVVLAQHTEDWTSEQLSTLGFDGFEMYNLHANTITGAGGVFELLGELAQTEDPSELPHPDLVFLNIVNEDPRYLDRWAEVLAAGGRAVTTMGTDCHRNTFATELSDGERIDSYRRMMLWFSNHLLIDGALDDVALKEALRQGRLYGAFEVLGYPEGFDYHAQAGGDVVEMGGEAALSGGVVLEAAMPAVRELDPDGPQPIIHLRLLRAGAGGWVEVDDVSGDLRHEVSEAGAYRVEVRMQPAHLERSLGVIADLAGQDFVWIYSNPIYVR